jgi:biotin carboxylase
MVVEVNKILLVLPSKSYRNQAFFDAARSLGVAVTVVTDQPYPYGFGDNVLVADLDRHALEGATERLLAQIDSSQYDAVVGVDDSSTLLAASLAQRLGLPSSSPEALAASSNKELMRKRLGIVEASQPRWLTVDPTDPDQSVNEIAAKFGTGPVVIKPLSLSQSRGVIRANNEAELYDALSLTASVNRHYGHEGEPLLVEEYIEGREVVLEGMLNAQKLVTLAIFDKPEPLTGPYFEETIYLTPTNLPDAQSKELHRILEHSCRSLGLSLGPIHAEFRLTEDGRPYLIELAARTIGGLCSKTLRFSTGETLEHLVILNALGAETHHSEQGRSAAGVVMLPTPASGIFQGLRNLDEIKSIPFVEEVDITAPIGSEVFAPPLSEQYLGFVFVRAPGRQAALQSLRAVLRVASVEIETAPTHRSENVAHGEQ